MSAPDPRAGAVRAGPLAIARTALAQLWALGFLIAVLPLALLCFPFDRRQRLHDLLSVVWARGVLALTGVRVEATGLAHVQPGEHYVIAANHQSTIDILAVLVVVGARTPLRFVAKRLLFLVPVLGLCMRLYGHTPVDRKSVRSSVLALRAARRNVAQRWSMVFFPEGTRSRTGELLPFQLGAFRIAADAGARVLPVTIAGSGALMPRGRYAAAPGVVRVFVHPPLPAPAVGPAELRAAAAACREAIAGSLPGGAAARAQVAPGASDTGVS